MYIHTYLWGEISSRALLHEVVHQRPHGGEVEDQGRRHGLIINNDNNNNNNNKYRGEDASAAGRDRAGARPEGGRGYSK